MNLALRLVSFRDRNALSLALKQTVAAVVIGAMLNMTGCALLQSAYTPGAVQTDTYLVVQATRAFVSQLPGGPAEVLLLNQFIAMAHSKLMDLANKIQTGQALLPTKDQVNAYLLQWAQTFGSPSWMLNFIGNLTTEYGKFYTIMVANEPKALAYINAFVNATV